MQQIICILHMQSCELPMLLVALLLATCMLHLQLHLLCFLHYILTHRFLSKREIACSLLRTSDKINNV